MDPTDTADMLVLVMLRLLLKTLFQRLNHKEVILDD